MAPVIALLGFMGSGKTAIGTKAAQLLGWDFIDLDEEVVRCEGRSIPEIFAQEGEESFRQLEASCLRRALERAGSRLVLALGGGTVTRLEGVPLLKDAFLIYLQVSSEEAWRRVRGTDRPLAQNWTEFASLAAARATVYAQVAHAVVHTNGRPVDEVAAEVAALVRRRVGGC